jgi:hypothetical protein
MPRSSPHGNPTIAFHFWDAVAKYLKRKKFPIYHTLDMDKILTLAQYILKNAQKYRVDTKPLLDILESPIPLTVERIKEALIKNKT